jgi:hypothetical protein
MRNNGQRTTQFLDGVATLMSLSGSYRNFRPWVPVVEALLDFGANRNGSCDGISSLLLTLAAEVGDCVMVRALIEKGVEIHQPPEGHLYTPLS